jgi:4-amino-4-deoxy-L-arabinose transferase-like glycosyltransferase
LDAIIVASSAHRAGTRRRASIDKSSSRGFDMRVFTRNEWTAFLLFLVALVLADSRPVSAEMRAFVPNAAEIDRSVAAALTLPALGSTSLWDIDEGLNAEAAREMFESGDYVVPNFNFKPRTAKPPLLYWLQAAAYNALGVSEFAARVPSAIAAVLVGLLTYRLGRRMFSPVTGLLAALILLSNVEMTVLSQAATPDAVLLLCLVLTMTLFWEGYAAGGGRWLWITGFGCGLAALAKGPIGLFMPFAIVSYFLLAQRELRRLWDWRSLGGVALTIVIAGPWYALVGAQTHGAFLRSFWRNDNVGRFLSSMEGHSGPFWYYLVSLALGLTPWCIFLIPAIWHSVKSISSRPESSLPDFSEGDTNRAAIRFLICWSVVYLGFFSLAQTKLPNYILPVFPPFALLMAHFLERWRLGRAEVPNWFITASLCLLMIIGVGTAVGGLIAGGAVLPRWHGRIIDGMAPWALVGAIPIAGAVLAWHFLRCQRRAAMLATVSIAAVVFLGLVVAGPMHLVDAQKATKPLVAMAGACRPTDEVRVASFCYFQPSLVFYCRREVVELLTERDALDFLRGPFPSYLVCPADVAAAIQARLPQTGVLASHRDFYKGWDVVVLGNDRAIPTVPATTDRLARVQP